MALDSWASKCPASRDPWKRIVMTSVTTLVYPYRLRMYLPARLGYASIVRYQLWSEGFEYEWPTMWIGQNMNEPENQKSQDI